MKKKDNEIDYGLEPTVNETIKTGVTGVTPSENYMEGVIGDIGNGKFFSGGIKESNRNNKIDMGYDSEYDKTYWLNYNPKYQQQADKFRGQAQEYGDFEYDYRTDPQFLAMANLYGNNAKKAMDQTLASASAANGGRLTSSAIAAASQAYQDKMANIEQEVPQLRQAAYNMYNDDYNRIRTNMLDAENAGINDYNIWSDNYDRMYTNAWDLIKQENWEKQYGLTKSTTESGIKVNDAQIRSQDAAIASTQFNDALSASEQMGYVTKDLADLIGVDEGTPIQSAREFVDRYKLELANSLGTVPDNMAQEYGFEKGGKTLDRENVEGTLAIGQQNANTNAANAATAAKKAQNDYQLGNAQLFYNIAESTGVFPGAYTSSFGYGDYDDMYTLDARKFAGSVYDSIGGYPAPFLTNLPYYGYPWVPNWQTQTYMAKMNGGSGINYGTSGGTSSGGGTGTSVGTSAGTSSGGGPGTSGGTMSTQSALDTVNKGGTYVDKINTAYALAGSGQITESQFNDILKNLGAK